MWEHMSFPCQLGMCFTNTHLHKSCAKKVNRSFYIARLLHRYIDLYPRSVVSALIKQCLKQILKWYFESLWYSSFILYMYRVFNRRKMEINQKAAEEEDRYQKEMEK